MRHQPNGFNAEQLGDSLSNHRGGLVTLQDCNRWGTPGQVEVNKGEITECPAALIDVQASPVPHLEADGFAVDLDRLAIKKSHLGRQKRHTRELKSTSGAFGFAIELKLVCHRVISCINDVIINPTSGFVKSKSMLNYVDFANRKNYVSQSETAASCCTIARLLGCVKHQEGGATLRERVEVTAIYKPGAPCDSANPVGSGALPVDVRTG
jgi:hypothetical protein